MKLLILDINGVLCCKVNKNSNINLQMQTINLNNYTVILRPGCREFLEYCYKNYNVGFYSSTPFYNANAILNILLTKEQHQNTIFKWYRDRTHIDPENKKFGTIKKIEDIFDNPVINEKFLYSYNNTILCDDSFSKTRFNNYKNIIIIPTFTGNSNDITLYNLINEIDKKFTELMIY